MTDVNGFPAVVAWTGTGPFLSMSLVVRAGRIQQVLVVRNPDQRAGLSVVVSGADLGSRG
jgi:hypothetical protein